MLLMLPHSSHGLPAGSDQRSWPDGGQPGEPTSSPRVRRRCRIIACIEYDHVDRRSGTAAHWLWLPAQATPGGREPDTSRDILTPMNDKTTTKLLLLAIILGLWANAVIPLFRPTSASAQNLGDIYSKVSSMESDLRRIQRGTCTNDKFC